jgi:DNA (cytosine-5)-methyltransferase 1
MKYGSVCSGIEAASVAWHPLGWKASFLSEIEENPRKVLAHHYPNTPLHGDFTTIQKDQYEPIKLLVGGTPCQSFSVAGLRAGLNDPRGNLMLEFGALADRLQPTWLVWENVPGVLSSNGGRDFGAFLGMLGELGYGFAYRVLDAQYFGVPQRRRRVFVVGHLGDWRRAAAVLFERDSLQGNPPPSRGKGQEIAGTLTRGFGDRGLDLDQIAGGGYALQKWPADIASTLNASFGSKMGYENQHINSGAPLFVPAYGIQSTIIGRKPENGHQGNGYNEEVSYTLTKTDQHAVAFQKPETFPIDTQNMTPGHASGGIGFGQDGDPSFTLTKGHVHAIAQQMQVRRLTPMECERLQGFPDNYTNVAGLSDSARYKALGNSMAVPVMRWIGERIEKVESLI